MIDKLEYLMALAREQHFGRAADSCGVTQPTLSAGIKQLEATLGVMLVQRGSRYIGLTPEGERTLDWARRIVGDARSMRQELKTLKFGLSGQLNIAAIPTALAIVESLTTPFREKHPDVRFAVHSRTSVEILNMLENLEIDAGISYLDNEPLGRVATVPLYQERYRLVTSANSPLGRRDKVTWKEVGDIPLCLLTPDMQNRRIIDGVFAQAGKTPRVLVETNSVMTLCSHIRTGAWSSVLPHNFLWVFGTPPGMLALPLTDPVRTHAVGLVVRDRAPASPLVAALEAIVRDAEISQAIGAETLQLFP